MFRKLGLTVSRVSRGRAVSSSSRFRSGSVFMPKLEVSRGSSVLLLPPPVFLVDLAEKHDAISAGAANENH